MVQASFREGRYFDCIRDLETRRDVRRQCLMILGRPQRLSNSGRSGLREALAEKEKEVDLPRAEVLHQSPLGLAYHL